MVQNDPKAKRKMTIKRKNYFGGIFRCFVHFWPFWGNFEGSKIEKISIFFRESIQIGLISILNLKSRKRHFHPRSKFSRWPLRNFRASLKDPKPEKARNIFFTGIHPRWSETHFKPKISEKTPAQKFDEVWLSTFLPFSARPLGGFSLALQLICIIGIRNFHCPKQ